MDNNHNHENGPASNEELRQNEQSKERGQQTAEPGSQKERNGDTSRSSSQGRKTASGGSPETSTRVNRRSPKSPK